MPSLPPSLPPSLDTYHIAHLAPQNFRVRLLLQVLLKALLSVETEAFPWACSTGTTAALLRAAKEGGRVGGREKRMSCTSFRKGERGRDEGRDGGRDVPGLGDGRDEEGLHADAGVVNFLFGETGVHHIDDA